MPTNLTRRLSLLYQRSGLLAFLDWWLAELWALVPDRLKQKLHLLPDRLLLRQQEDGRYRWELHQPRQQRVLGELDPSRPEDALRARQWLEALEPRKTVIWLLLQPDRVLRRTLRLPLAARDNLRQVLRFEMDRHTPFTAEQVVFDARPGRVDAETGLLEVDLMLMPRQRMEALLEQLKPWQLPLSGIAVQGLEPDTNLLPEDLRPARDESGRRIDRLLAAVAVVLVFLLGFNAIDKRRQELERLDQQIAQARQGARQATELRQRLDQAVQSAIWLHERKQAHPVMVQALLEITRALPDDAWLQRLEFGKGQFKLQGLAVSANELLRKLDDLPHLHRAEIIGAITEDRTSHKERFHIRLSPRTDQEREDALAAGEG